MPHNPIRPLALGVLLGLGLLGCGGDGRRPVHPVRGKVVFQGRPTPEAVVILHPEGGTPPDSPRPVGYVDKEGNFEVTSYAARDGAPEGTYRVSIAWNLASRVAGRADETVTHNYLPARYARPETSGLRVTVTRGQNQFDPFTLTR